VAGTFGCGEDEPLEQRFWVEEEQEANLEACCAEIAQHLGLERRVRSAHCFELQQDGGFNDHVRSKGADLLAPKMNRNRHLPFNAESQIGEDALHRGTVERFRKAKAELSVHLKEPAKDLVRDLSVKELGLIHRPILVPRHSALSAKSAAKESLGVTNVASPRLDAAQIAAAFRG
jgi:hypothetical protein